MQPNKAIVGRNAFAHEAGIHQDGVLKDRTTYEIMDATTIGLQTNSIVLGKHSGRHALRKALEELGVRVDGQALNTAFKRFKEIADRRSTSRRWTWRRSSRTRSASRPRPTTWRRFELHDASGQPAGGEGRGDDAERARPCRARAPATAPSTRCSRPINAATGLAGVLKEYHVSAVTADTDALGEVSVLVELDGRLASGQSVSTDTLEASARAYLRALSNVLAGCHRGGAGRRETEASAQAVADAGLHLDRRRAADPLRRLARSPRRPALLAGPRLRGLRAADHRARRRSGAGGGQDGADWWSHVPSGAGLRRLRPRCGSASTAGRWWRSAAGA